MIDVCMLRKGLCAEYETVNDYKKMMDLCETADAKKLFADIIEEEIVHAGEFEYLIERLCQMSAEKFEEGKREAAELLADAPMIDGMNPIKH